MFVCMWVLSKIWSETVTAMSSWWQLKQSITFLLYFLTQVWELTGSGVQVDLPSVLTSCCLDILFSCILRTGVHYSFIHSVFGGQRDRVTTTKFFHFQPQFRLLFTHFIPLSPWTPELKSTSYCGWGSDQWPCWGPCELSLILKHFLAQQRYFILQN